jgi:hypothetical protein
MTNKDIRDLEMLIRVRQFGASHSASFPADSRGGELLTLVDSIIREMEGHASAQDSGKRAAKEKTAQKNVAFDQVFEDLEVVSRTARAMSPTTPGLADKFRMPRSMAEQACLATARSFAEDAEPLKAEFIRRGLPADFFDTFDGKITALEESINSKAQKTGARVAATVAVSDAAKRGRSAVRELDAIVRNIFRSDPSALAEWESASHTERATHHAAAKPPAQAAPPKE